MTTPDATHPTPEDDFDDRPEAGRDRMPDGSTREREHFEEDAKGRRWWRCIPVDEAYQFALDNPAFREYVALHPTPRPEAGELAASCPCGGRCHHSESPCSLGCWAAQKPWRPEEEYQRGLRAATHRPEVEGLPDIDEFTAVLIRTFNEQGWSVYRSARVWVDRRRVASLLRAALAAAKPSPTAREDYRRGWNDAMEHAARTADSLIASSTEPS